MPQLRRSLYFRDRVIRDRPPVSRGEQRKDASLVGFANEAASGGHPLRRANKDSLPAQHHSCIRRSYFTMKPACRAFLALVLIDRIHGLHAVSKSQWNA
jgi:hypothetical protein